MKGKVWVRSVEKMVNFRWLEHSDEGKYLSYTKTIGVERPLN